MITIADDAFGDVTLNVLVIRNTSLTLLSNQWINGFRSLKILDKRGIKVIGLPKSATNDFRKLATIYTDDLRLCCVLKNIHGCQSDRRSKVRCRLFSHSIVSPVLIVLSTTISVFIMTSLWCVFKLFANSSPSHQLIHCSILLNRLLCACYVLAIAIIDVIHGEYYIFWYTSLSNRLACQISSVMLSSGMVMSNFSISLLDYITHMAVTGMLYKPGSAYSKVKVILFSSHLFVITAFTMLIYLTHDLVNHQLSAHQLSSSPLGLSFVNYNWLGVGRIGPVTVAIVIVISFLHSIFVIYTKTHSSGKCVHSMASTEIDNHKARLIKLLTTLCHSTVLRSLECLPTISLIFLAVCGTDISLEIQLVSILASASFGCLCNTTTSIWKQMFSQKRK